MMLIGLAGSAGSGKDTIADYLVKQHGFTKFSFSDGLYREVSDAFNVPVEELQDRNNKERPHPQLTVRSCSDASFCAIMLDNEIGLDDPVSPRWVLQRWGTEYRRAQDPEYWLKKAALWVKAWLQVTRDDGQHHAGLVNTSVRFPNEQAWINELQGVVWHVRRLDAGECASQLDHVAEQHLAEGATDRVIWNTGTIEQLHTAVSLLLQAPLEADPVASVPAGGPLVVCKHCGKLHYALTEEGVRTQLAALNEVVWSGKEPTIDDWRGCTGCGGTEFAALEVVDPSALHDVLVLPVLLEEKDNG